MPRYLLTDAAKSDIREIIAYIRPRSRQAATQVRQKLKAACEKLAAFPYLGHRRDDVPRADLRFWSVYSYLIVYRPDHRPIEVVRVLHGAQDVPRFFKT